MVGLLILGGVALASSGALIYDYMTDNKEQQPAVVINTETATATTGEIDRTKLIALGMLLVGALVYLKYIRKK